MSNIIFFRFNVTLMCIFLFCCSTIIAQSYTFGIRAGSNWSNVYGDVIKTEGADQSYKFNNGFSFGLTTTMYTSLNFGFSCDMLYSQRGTVFHDINSSMSTETKKTFHYLEIPITFKYIITRFKNYRPNIFAGIQAAYLINATENIEGNDIAGNRKARIYGREISKEYNSFDFGFIFGGGFNAALIEGYWLALDARYFAGLSDITKSNTNTSNSGFSLTGAIQIMF